MVVLHDNVDVLVYRDPEAGARPLPLLKNIYVEFGTKADWELLQELHYKGHTLAAGPKFMRCVYDDAERRETIGVLVFGNVRPLDRDRMRVFPALKPNQSGGFDSRLMNQHRMKWLNHNIAWNNRTVLDTMYRSAGIAYRFKNLAYRLYCAKSGFKFVESRSSMGKFNPFSIKAGMKFTKPTAANALENGIQFFTTYFRSNPYDSVAIMAELAAMEPSQRTYTEKKLREFYYANSSMEKSGDKRLKGTTRVDGLDLLYVLKQTQQLVFGATVYWLWGPNPDAGRTLPERLPLNAFDLQGPNEPLRLDLLETLK
jgi:uncharacterized protein